MIMSTSVLFKYIIVSEDMFTTITTTIHPMTGMHRCQPSRNRAGNPAFLLISRIPTLLRERPAVLDLFRNNKKRLKSQSF